jgi:hypothetical protein
MLPSFRGLMTRCFFNERGQVIGERAYGVKAILGRDKDVLNRRVMGDMLYIMPPMVQNFGETFIISVGGRFWGFRRLEKGTISIEMAMLMTASTTKGDEIIVKSLNPFDVLKIETDRV